MTTMHPRLNVTFLPETTALLNQLAKREGKSVAGLTKELVLDALERREDIGLSLMAESREKEARGKKTISHAEAWK